MSKSDVVAYINSPYITVKLPLPAIYELSGNACKLYSLMRFRMVMSIDGKKYYDFKNGHYYIIYTNKELNAIAHLKKNAFYNAINELKQKGYIKKTSTKRRSLIRLPKAEPYYVPRYNLKPRKTGLNNKLDNPYIKLGSLNNKPQGLNSKPRNRTNINNQYDKQNYNCFYINNAENKFSDVIKKTHKKLGLSINSLKAISGFSRSYKEFSSIINKLFTITSYKHNHKLNYYYNKLGIFIGKKLRNFKTSPYFTNNEFVSDLCDVFGQIDHNTKDNNKTPNRNEYGGYFVSKMTERMIDYLEHNNYIKKGNKRTNNYQNHRGIDHSKIDHKIMKKWKYDNEHAKKPSKKMLDKCFHDNLLNYAHDNHLGINIEAIKNANNKPKDTNNSNTLADGSSVTNPFDDKSNNGDGDYLPWHNKSKDTESNSQGFGNPVEMNTGQPINNKASKSKENQSKDTDKSNNDQEAMCNEIEKEIAQ